MNPSHTKPWETQAAELAIQHPQDQTKNILPRALTDQHQANSAMMNHLTTSASEAFTATQPKEVLPFSTVLGQKEPEPSIQSRNIAFD